jgi:hypothetical protein
MSRVREAGSGLRHMDLVSRCNGYGGAAHLCEHHLLTFCVHLALCQLLRLQ